MAGFIILIFFRTDTLLTTAGDNHNIQYADKECGYKFAPICTVHKLNTVYPLIPCSKGVTPANPRTRHAFASWPRCGDSFQKAVKYLVFSPCLSPAKWYNITRLWLGAKGKKEPFISVTGRKLKWKDTPLNQLFYQ
jgi:hypothetical protein